MLDLTKAKTLQNTIRRVLSMPASGLTRVPEIEDDSTEDAIRKLQIQIFELSDTIASLVPALEHLQQNSGKGPRIYP